MNSGFSRCSLHFCTHHQCRRPLAELPPLALSCGPLPGGSCFPDASQLCHSRVLCSARCASSENPRQLVSGN